MRVKAILGGFHLMNPITNRMEESESDVLAIASELRKKYPGIKIYTGHCTGVEGYTILKSCLGDGIEYITTGSVFCIN
jgi:7,8-dihydropterin-6-yl-methyl-4-(beta-D-ribofuranosyl)aminobenzene 5'-phosphate synthase